MRLFLQLLNNGRSCLCQDQHSHKSGKEECARVGVPRQWGGGHWGRDEQQQQQQRATGPVNSATASSIRVSNAKRPILFIPSISGLGWYVFVSGVSHSHVTDV